MLAHSGEQVLLQVAGRRAVAVCATRQATAVVTARAAAAAAVSATMMAENDAGCDERLVACLNILRRMPTEDAEEVRLQDAYR